MRLPTATLAFLLGFVASACSDGAHEAQDVVFQGCAANADCPGGRCVLGLPGGLCTRNCAAHDDCPDGTLCIDTEAHGGVCLFPCSNDGQCVETLGAGYTCDTESNLETGEDVLVCIDA